MQSGSSVKNYIRVFELRIERGEPTGGRDSQSTERAIACSVTVIALRNLCPCPVNLGMHVALAWKKTVENLWLWSKHVQWYNELE